MKINKLKITNFLSVESIEIDFDSYGNLVRIVGENRDTNPYSSNGAGKSSIIEAIVFALFGKTIRKTTEKSIINTFTKGKCSVELTVNDNVVITRVKKPPMLSLSVDGDNYTKSSIQETQKYLEQILNTNYTIFLASIVFGQENSTNFLSSSPEEKRAIIQSFLNLSDVFKYRTRIKSLKSKFNSDKRIASTLQGEATAKVKSLVGKIKACQNNKKNISKLLSSDKAEFIENNTPSEIRDKERVYHDKVVELRAAVESKEESKSELVSVTGRIQSFVMNPCEFCSKVPTQQNQAKNFLIESKKSLEQKLEDINEKLAEVSKECDSLTIPVTAKDFESIDSLKTIDSEILFFRKQKREQTKLRKKYAKKVALLQKRYDLMRFWEAAFSEQGLIKFIIRNILTFFNERSKYYLNVLSKGALTIVFDELLNETISTKKKKVFYGALSGGEKKKVSLSVMLALNDLLVLSGKDRSDILFFDEIADSLDEEGIHGLYELIESITQNKKLFIITHNEHLSGIIDEHGDNMTIIKRNNKSKLT